VGRGRYLALWLLLLLGAILRLWGLKSFPLIEDEMTSFYEARGLWWDTHFEMGMMSRPLYFILLHPIVEAFPHSPVAWRILPFVFGILGIWATWRLARELVPDAPPWIAALLAATAPFLIYISGFGRYWSLIYFLSALTIGELSRAYRVQTAGAYLRALVPLVLGSLTHPTFLFPVVGVLLALHLFDNAGRLRWTWPGRKAWVWLYLPYLACMAGFGMILLARSEVGSLHNGPPRGTAALTRLVPTFIELIGPVTFVAALLGVLLLTTYYYWAWNRVGRDPPGRVIIPEYQPPEKQSPASMRYLMQMGYDDPCFAAGVLSLAVKGYLRIRQEAGILGIGRNFTLEKTAAGAGAATPAAAAGTAPGAMPTATEA